MRIVASACLVIAILFMVGCGTSAEDKKAIQDQGTRLTALETRVGNIEKMGPDMMNKMTTVWNYLTANPIGKAKFPPDTMAAKMPPPTGKTGGTPPPTTPPTTAPKTNLKKAGAGEAGTKK